MTAQSGIININKPQNITSNRIVELTRRVVGFKKVGHTGTLDPFASGVLIVCLGNTCRLSEYIRDEQKTYTSELMLGEITDTFDVTGIKKTVSSQKPTLKEIKTTLQSFSGEQTQLPPMYSAKKIKGRKLYQYAREGETVERTPHKINILNIKLINYNYPSLKIQITCSAGTYIRTLGNDIGSKLGTGAFVKTLNRTDIGIFNINQSVPFAELTRQNWRNFVIPPYFAVNSMSKINLTPAQSNIIKRGNPVKWEKVIPNFDKFQNIACLTGPKDTPELIAIAKYNSSTKEILPVKVL